MFLYSFGLDPGDFVNEALEPLLSDDGTTIYNIRQEVNHQNCPECGCTKGINIHSYYWTETKFTSNKGTPVVIRIRHIQFKCKSCGKIFTVPINGIDRYAKISEQVKTLIKQEFYSMKSFRIIADDYHLSVTQVIHLFDHSFPYIKKEPLSTALCIDEIGYKTENGSYASILYDHDRKVIIDVIRNRQSAYLNDYFSFISLKERSKVKYFISDLYVGYAEIKEKFFPQAVHIADLFHITHLLKMEVSRLRKLTMKQRTDEDDIERYFMKRHWNYFELPLYAELANRSFYSKKEKYEYNVWNMMEKCLKLNPVFWDAYACLQELLKYPKYPTFTEGINFVKRIVNKLRSSCDENLDRVARTYWLWRNEIANALCIKTSKGTRYSNGPAEGLNNSIKTLIKDANGYKNFDRFRKRVLISITHKKIQKGPKLISSEPNPN